MSGLTHAGLQRDLWQFEDQLPTPHGNHGNHVQSTYLNGDRPRYTNGEEKIPTPLIPQSSLGSKQIYGIQKTTFWLTVALAIAMSLGVVGTGIAGSLAVKRERIITNQTSSAQPDSSGTSTNPVSANPVSTNPVSTVASSCPTLPPPTPCNTPNSTHVATTECETLPQPPKTYVSRLTLHEFSISCSTDYPGGDIVGVFVYNFFDCIEACSSYNSFSPRDRNLSNRDLNSTCLGVSYNLSFQEADGKGNCYLKWSLGDGPVWSNITSSAIAVRV